MSAHGNREPEGVNGDAARSLDAAISATRRAFDGESGRVAATERRILEATRGRKRLRPGTWLVPLAAAFIASAAVAGGFGAFGTLRSRLFGDALPVPPPATSASRPVVDPAPSAPPVRPVAAAAASVNSAAPSAVPPPAARSSVATAPQAVAPAPAEPAPLGTAPPAELEGMALYREAHRAHFSERNYVLALSHWDRYLALAPRGALVLEARYNRGVALYRLGLREAAVEALRPFAEGAYGGYRSVEAARMLEELR